MVTFGAATARNRTCRTGSRLRVRLTSRLLRSDLRALGLDPVRAILGDKRLNLRAKAPEQASDRRSGGVWRASQAEPNSARNRATHA